MLHGESSSSSTSSSCFASSRWKYHVFLSFRGKDTRLHFIDHLYAALLRKGIITFRDDKQIEKGDVISKELLESIEQSLAAIVVLSENYASSTWCLDELQKIVESKREVFPVFYGVRPSEVRHQRNSFAEAFEEHAKRFVEDKEKVQKWRDSLREVAGISGWVSKNKHEAELIEDIVEKVWIKLEPRLLSNNDEVVGIDSSVKEMDSLLSVGSEDVRFIGIWGMGGIGKTTLARVLYDRIYSQFEIFCFLSSVREVSKSSDGLLCLQRKLLSTLKISNLEVDDLHDGKKKIRNLLCNKKVLLVLDDISSLSQLENLAKSREWFGSRSRVIITTRDMHLLVSHGVCKKFKMKILNASDSFLLFSHKAFKKEQPPKQYSDLTKIVVQYAGGLPLALEVLGSFLHGRCLYEWEDAVAKMKQVPLNEILSTLRISYDGLEDSEKALFLDIAFFFTGKFKVEVIQILRDCGLHPTIGISLLIEKSLATCHGGILEMHDLLQEMGRSVVLQESPDDASRRSRLCSLEDINAILRKNKGTEFIQGIILKLNGSCEVDWHPEAFSKMHNLRVFIILCDLKLPFGLKCLSSSLKFLEWKGCPLQDLPLGLPLDELVHLKMPCSKFKRLWNRTQHFRKLKSIDLTDSRDLIETPDISGVPHLERLVLKGCKNLVVVHQSVPQHKNLALFSLEGCISLKTLPRKLKMNALKELILSGCSQIKKLPEFGEGMKCLSVLNLRDCKSLVCLPQSTYNLKSLRNLNICGCSKNFSLPNNLLENTTVEELDVSEIDRRQVPSSSSDCHWLISNSCSIYLPTKKGFDSVKYPLSMNLKLPPLSSFHALKKLNLRYCNLNDGSIPADIGHLSSLEELDLAGNNFVNLGTSIGNLPRLHRLGLSHCRRLRTLPVLPPTIYQLFLHDCTRMAPISFNPERMWKTFEANRWNLKHSPWFTIPGSEIPPWFENPHCFPLDPQLINYDHDEKYAFVASIIVDIPNYYTSSDWIGIVVCLSLKSSMKRHKHHNSPIVVRLGFQDPDKEMMNPLHSLKQHWTSFRGPHLFITIFGSDHKVFKPYLRGDQNKVQLIISGENSCKCGELELRNCGTRVVCKKEEVWCKGEAATEIEDEMPSISAHSGVLNQSRITRTIDYYLERDVASAWDSANQNLHPYKKKLNRTCWGWFSCMF